jgi:hypothetical protein
MSYRAQRPDVRWSTPPVFAYAEIGLSNPPWRHPITDRGEALRRQRSIVERRSAEAL